MRSFHLLSENLYPNIQTELKASKGQCFHLLPENLYPNNLNDNTEAVITMFSSPSGESISKFGKNTDYTIAGRFPSPFGESISK